MIKISKTENFTTDVFLRMPGSAREDSFKATFKHLEKAKVEEMTRDLRDGRMTDEEFLDRVLVKVSGIGTDEGELPEADQLAWVRSTHAAASACGVAFFREIAGASEKNASRSRVR